MDRRAFLTNLALTGAAMAASSVGDDTAIPKGKGRFKLKYAPHFGQFKAHAGGDMIDQLQFVADEGFEAFEDNGLMERDRDVQNKIAAALERLRMTMGVFTAYGSGSDQTFVKNDPQVRQMLVARIKEAVELAKRMRAGWMTVVPACYDKATEWDYQTANVIENLKWCADICEPAGVVMVLEPLNWWRNHPGLFLHKIPQAYQICQAVGSPSCKILNDIYHQQITEGNLIPNIDMAWERIAYFHLGDNPGRKEPGTGEINFRNIFKHLHGKGYNGVLGMEHGQSRPGKEGERAVIDAYVACDDF